jgi:hypothetical protein
MAEWNLFTGTLFNAGWSRLFMTEQYVVVIFAFGIFSSLIEL